MNEPTEKLGREKRISVAYLMKAKDERPAGLDKFFDKLAVYENSMRELMDAKAQAENSLNEIYRSTEQMFGSINSVVEIIAEELPDDKVVEWASKYKPPVADPSMPGGREVKRADPVDIAGATARQSNPIQTPPGFNPGEANPPV